MDSGVNVTTPATQAVYRRTSEVSLGIAASMWNLLVQMGSQMLPIDWRNQYRAESLLQVNE